MNSLKLKEDMGFKNNGQDKPEKTGNFSYLIHFFSNIDCFFTVFYLLETHFIAEKNEEIKMLNSIILGLHKKLSAVMETDVSELEM